MDMASITTEVKTNPNIPALAPGDTVKVKVKIKEGDKERVQAFQGIVIRIRNSADGGNFTVRRVAYGIGVERTFLFQSPLIEKVELVRHGRVRRAKLYYLRGLSTKAARIKEKKVEEQELAIEAPAAAETTEETAEETTAEVSAETAAEAESAATEKAAAEPEAEEDKAEKA